MNSSDMAKAIGLAREIGHPDGIRYELDNSMHTQAGTLICVGEVELLAKALLEAEQMVGELLRGIINPRVVMGDPVP